jgi:hypothetical protein
MRQKKQQVDEEVQNLPLELSPPQMFLSYAKEDRDRVERIYHQLRRDRLNPWMDRHQLEAGYDWDYVIRATIRKCRIFAVFLSRHSVSKRGYVQREIKEALDVVELLPDNTVFIIPVRLEDCELPERLRRWQWVDLFQRGGYGRLRASTIKALGNDFQPPRKRRPNLPAIPRFLNPADAVLFEHFCKVDAFKYGRLSAGRYVLSDETFMLIRRDLPPPFLKLENVVTRSARLSPKQIRASLPERATYALDKNHLRTLSHLPSGLLDLAAFDKNSHCSVDPQRWRFVDLYFSNYDVYVTSPDEPAIVEIDEEIVFVVSPAWNPTRQADDETGEYEDGEYEYGEYQHEEYDPSLIEGDRQFFDNLPFSQRE